LQSLEGHDYYTFGFGVSFSPDGQTIASASWDNSVKLWDLSGRELQTFEGHSGRVSGVSFSPDGQTIISASWDDSVKLWDLSGQELQTFEGHSWLVSDVSFSPDGQTIASASWDGIVKLWDLSGRELQSFGQEFQSLESHSGQVSGVSFSPDGQTIASASWDGTVKLWDLSGRELQTLEGHSGQVSGVSFSPDGQTIASASGDGTVKLWDLSGRELQTLEGHSGQVSGVSFSPDGQTIASASRDGTVKLWDLSGRELQTLEGHSGQVSGVSFSPDGQTIASASGDGTVKLWDLSGQELQTLEGHSGQVSGVSFSPDGQTIASASYDGTVKLWNFNQDDLIARVCDWIVNYLTTHPQDLITLEICQTPSLLASAAPELVIEALQTARRGNFDKAAEQLQTAQTWNSSVDLDPDTDEIERDPIAVVVKRVALHRVSIAERLASQGDTAGAITAYHEALALSPSVDLDPSTEKIRETDPVELAQRLSAPGKVKVAERLVREGNINEAISVYKEALALDPTVDLDPSTEDVQETDPIPLVANGLLKQGKDLAQKGEIDEAIQVYRQSQELGLDITDKDWSLLCWSGSRFDVPNKVLFACDNATNLASDDLWGQQSRSIARALVDDLAGAAQDLQVVVDWLDSDQAPFLPDEFKVLRQQWLSTLQNMQNPFDSELIEQVPESALSPGDLQVTLDWTGAVDLDLDVFDPNGDRRDIERYSNCAEPFPTTTQIDNVLWPLDSSPPVGNYTVIVNFDEACSEDGPTSADFSLNVLFQGQLQTFTGKVTAENPSEEFEFSIPPNR
ncbi:MAG: hypothetical protein F6K11_25705, partial [Leptolyngbya sp. SIO3F4]|nr:hypothetical protein [Leptolyngbya sp. SIO3F4]